MTLLAYKVRSMDQDGSFRIVQLFLPVVEVVIMEREGGDENNMSSRRMNKNTQLITQLEFNHTLNINPFFTNTK